MKKFRMSIYEYEMWLTLSAAIAETYNTPLAPGSDIMLLDYIKLCSRDELMEEMLMLACERQN